MYLSKPQLDAITLIARNKHEDVAPELIEYLLGHGIIEPEMFGYRLTQLGEQSCIESSQEQRRLANDMSDTIGIKKRTRFTADDDISQVKRKQLDPNPTKAKPQTRYKPIK